MTPDIIIPTIKDRETISPLVCDVEGWSYPCKVIPTCQNMSAAKQRNYGLDQATTDIVIMIDDDVMGFSLNWWSRLIQPLIDDDSILMVSARLMRDNGEYGAMMFPGDVAGKVCEVEAVPTACCAFRNNGMRFHEGFRKSGFEDTWFCHCLKRQMPGGKIVINNEVRIVHINEEKGQREEYAHNKALFDELMQTGKWEDCVHVRS